jgi:hypothetical protein
MTLKPGGARLSVEWGYGTHEIVVTPRNWSQIKRGRSLRIRTTGYSEEGFQWEYWSFDGGLDGRLLVEYGDEGEQVSTASCEMQQSRKRGKAMPLGRERSLQSKGAAGRFARRKGTRTARRNGRLGDLDRRSAPARLRLRIVVGE